MSTYNQSTKSKTHHDKCVCEICQCGNHKCPTTTNQYPKSLIKTTFQKDFIPFKISKNESFKSNSSKRLYPYEKQLLESNYMSEYKKFQQPPAEKYSRYTETAGSDLPFPKGSEYSQNFKELPGTPSKPIEQQTWTKLNIPFNSSSIYKSDFNKYKTPYESSRYKNQCELSLSKDHKFNGKSTYKNDFLKYNCETTKSLKKEQIRTETVPFDANTIYHISYSGYDPKMYEKHKCPVDELPQRPRQLSPGKNHLVYKYPKNGWQ